MRPRHALAIALLAGAGTAAAQDLNRITAVEVRDEGKTVSLSVTGSKPPNFTTFSMADPPRFVLDLSEARFQGVPEDLPVNDGTILVVKNLSYGADATSIARIMIAFSVDVDPPDVQAQGNALVVRVVKPAGVAVAKGPSPAELEAQRAKEALEAQRRAEAEAAARAEAKARADAEAQARAEAEVKAEAERAAARAREQQAATAAASGPAAGGAPADTAALLVGAQTGEPEKKVEDDAAKEQAAAVARAEAERAAQAAIAAQAAEDEKARAQAESERQRQEALAAAKAEQERKKQEILDRKAEEKRRREEAVAAAKAEKERKRQEALEKKLAAQREREEKLAAARAERERKRQEAAERAAEARRQREEAIAAAKADAERKRQEAAEARAEAKRQREEALAAARNAAQLREVGFRQMPGVSRVFVRTSAPPRFTIQDVGENLIRVELENTRVARRNDVRFLDTSFFPSAVALITPSRRGTTYVVDIKLKQKVPYQQRLEGDMLAIDFERPGAPAQADAPAPGAEPAAASDAPVEQPAALESPAEPAGEAKGR